jgi:hypothetical protein
VEKKCCSLHHRKPRSQGKSQDPRKVILLPHAKHEAWHLLFGSLTPLEIAEEINAFYLDRDFELVARRRDAQTE